MGLRVLMAALVAPFFACGVPSVTFYDDAKDGSSDVSTPTAESGAESGIAFDAAEASTACGNLFLGCIGPACDGGAICTQGCDRCRSTEYCCAKSSESVTCHSGQCP
jgi:hypothetical protein